MTRDKKCPKCGETKLLSDYGWIKTSHTYHTYCNPCRSTYMKKYKKNPKTAREYMLKKYGLTIEEYETLFAKQGYRCAICRKVPTPQQRMCVDHCHETQVVRGILCTSCNRGVGLLGDDPASVKRALEYLVGATS